MGNCREITAFECNSYFTLLSQLVVVATQKSSENSSGLFPHLWWKPHPGWKQPLANRDEGIHLWGFVWDPPLEMELSTHLFFLPQNLCFFWTRELEKNLANRQFFFLFFFEDWKEFESFRFHAKFYPFLFWSILSIGHGTDIVTSRI